MRSLTSLLGISMLLLVGCAGHRTQFAHDPNFPKIAIIPFELKMYGQHPMGEEANSHIRQEDEEAKIIQKELIKRISGKSRKFGFKVQSFNTTNRLIADKIKTYEALRSASPKLLCEVLGVDFIIIGRVNTREINPFGNVLATSTLMMNNAHYTSKINLEMFIYDLQDHKFITEITDTYGTTSGTEPALIAKRMYRHLKESLEKLN